MTAPALEQGLAARLWRWARLRRARRRRLAFCAIATRDFLPWALVLFDSLRRHHPGAHLALLHVRREGEPREAPVIEGVKVLSVEDLVDQQAQAGLRRRFTLPELCFALKPRLLRHALDHLGERAIYLDTDIDVVGPLDEACIALESASAALTPHLDTPLPLDGRMPSDLTILRAGACNLGFVGIAECAEARALLEWWDARVRRWGFVAPEMAYQGDQKWIDLAPSLFPSAVLLRDAGSNVAYWNLHSRRIGLAEGRYLAEGAPLSFVHFSGLDPDMPAVLSRHQNRIDPAEVPDVMRLAQDFARRIVAARDAVRRLHWRPAGEPAPRDATATLAEGAMPDEAYRARIAARLEPGILETGEEAVAHVTVTNASSHVWQVVQAADGHGGIALTWHLRDAAGSPIAWDNRRFFLVRDLGPGESIDLTIGIRVPHQPGHYRAELDLVHESFAWFADKGGETASVDLFVGRFDGGGPR